jgi:hypothetical protein
MRRAAMILSIAFSLTASASDCDAVFSGRYYWGAEVDAFHPCGEATSYWVSASSWIQAPLIELVKAGSKQPYQPVFIRFRGHLLDEVRDGFAEDYDGLIRISEILEMRAELPADCQE